MEALTCIIPASRLDVDRLLPECIGLCFQNVWGILDVNVITPNPSQAERRLTHHPYRSRIRVIADCDILPPSTHTLSGWARQQLIKLGSYKLTTANHVVCLSADTFILRPIGKADLFFRNRPIMYFNYYDGCERHIEYERARLANVAALLRIKPHLAAVFVDFIIDLKVFQCNHLRDLEHRLASLHGPDWAMAVLSGSHNTLEQKKQFGEWTAYALYVLDLAEDRVLLSNTRDVFFAQAHSEASFAAISSRSKPPSIVHFVSKDFSLEALRSYLTRADSAVRAEDHAESIR